MHSLSVIIITKNEARNIVRCLESVKLADEIIIVDSGSTDNTLALASQYQAKIYHAEWAGYGIQKNRALDKSTSEWILSIDADEVVSKSLWEEVQATIQNPEALDAYSIIRKSSYCNKKISFGDWKNDRCLRLFRKTKARFKELPVHESLVVDGHIGILKKTLYHYSFPSLEDVLKKLNEYSTLSASHKFQQGRRSGLVTAIWHGAWTFFRGYFLRLGFLDGKFGFMLAVSNAEGCYYRYLKMMLLNHHKKSHSSSNETHI